MSDAQTRSSPLIVGLYNVQSRDNDWLAAATGRFGWALDRWMLFAKGGAAWRRRGETAYNTTFNRAGSVIAVEQNSHNIFGLCRWRRDRMGAGRRRVI